MQADPLIIAKLSHLIKKNLNKKKSEYKFTY
jgi:hypothetical protein